MDTPTVTISPNLGVEVKCRLVINGSLYIDSYNPMPSAWHRFWTRFLLGWEWRGIERYDMR